jgi:chromosome segregation ATPase
VDEDVKELIGSLADEMRRGFAKVDEAMRSGFAKVDSRFEKMDARFDQVDARFDQVDARFEQVDARFEQVDARFDQVDARIDSVESRLDVKIDTKFEEAKRYFGVLADELRGQIRAAAEGDAVTKRENAERFDSLSSEIAEIKSMIPISFIQLDGRIRSLETDNADLHSRVERLESAAH